MKLTVEVIRKIAGKVIKNSPLAHIFIRTSPKFTDKFTDFMFVFLNQKLVFKAAMSTKPGIVSLRKHINVYGMTGCAIMMPLSPYNYSIVRLPFGATQQHNGSYLYEPTMIKSYRHDGNKLGVTQMLSHKTYAANGLIGSAAGLNVHRAWNDMLVGNASEGCLTMPDTTLKKWDQVLAVANSKGITKTTGIILPTYDF